MVDDAQPPVQPICPECKQGKHDNCTQDVLDDNDDWVKCACARGLVPQGV